MQNGPLNLPTVKNWISQIQDGGRPPFWKPLNATSLQQFVRFWWNLACWRILAPYSESYFKISIFWKSKMAAAAILKITKIAMAATV